MCVCVVFKDPLETKILVKAKKEKKNLSIYNKTTGLFPSGCIAVCFFSLCGFVCMDMDGYIREHIYKNQ